MWGTNCTPHGIKSEIALTHALDVLFGIVAVGKSFYNIKDAEIIEFLVIVPVCAYLFVSE